VTRTHLLAASAALAVAVSFGGGCAAGATPSPAPASASSAVPANSPSAAPASPAVLAACQRARQEITAATAKFSAELADAVTAGERGDAAAQRAAMKQLAAVFADWADALREQAGGVADPEVKALLTEYAGAVDATIARVHGPEDLERLATFDDQELDIMANRFADVCG
jgi:hypothetical protein